jgi:hypothetical protein
MFEELHYPLVEHPDLDELQLQLPKWHSTVVDACEETIVKGTKELVV